MTSPRTLHPLAAALGSGWVWEPDECSQITTIRRKRDGASVRIYDGGEAEDWPAIAAAMEAHADPGPFVVVMSYMQAGNVRQYTYTTEKIER